MVITKCVKLINDKRAYHWTRWSREGDFPKPFNCKKGSRQYWRAEDIERFINNSNVF